MKHINTFFTDKPTGKFVALFADGSGARLFWEVDGENGMPAYADGESGDLVPEPETYFVESGYSHWIALPDSFQLWFEQVPA